MKQTSVYERNAELLERVQMGDGEAEAALVEENWGLVRNETLWMMLERKLLEKGIYQGKYIQL
jgi:hypothetical protein